MFLKQVSVSMFLNGRSTKPAYSVP